MDRALSRATEASASVARELPDDIVKEIFRHCRGLNWSYRDLARLCLVDRTWAYYGRRVLYQDLRLDYRHEVEELALSLQHAPHSAELVKSLVINGDGAHAAYIHRLLSLVQHTVKHIHFFDFELPSLLVQQTLCRAIPQYSLTSLEFAVLPADFVLLALERCCGTLVSLRIYRVDLSYALAGEDMIGREEKLCFPALKHLSLSYTGSLRPGLFKVLIQATSSRLLTLKLRYDRPYPICEEGSMPLWTDCRFRRLASLELGSFQVGLVTAILRDTACNFSSLQSLKLYCLRQRDPPERDNQGGTSEASQTATANAIPTGVLECLPPSLQLLELQDCRSSEVCQLLPSKLAEKPLWLPHLKSAPVLTVGARAIPRLSVPALKEQYIKAAKERNLPVIGDSVCYAVEGFWD